MPSAPWAWALAVFPACVGFLHRGPHLRHGELRIADVGAGSEDSAAGDELDVVGAGLDLLACRTPDLVGAVDLPAEQMPAVTAGHAQCAAAQQQPRREAQSFFRRAAQREVDGDAARRNPARSSRRRAAY